MDVESRILYGPRDSQPDVSLGHHLMACLTRHGDKVAQVQQVNGRLESRSFCDLELMGKRVAGFLRARGLQSGDVVWVCCGNNLAYTPILLGTLFIGATLAPVLHLSDVENMLHMLGIIEPQLVIINPEAESALTTAISQFNRSVHVVTLDTMEKAMDTGDVSDFALAHIEDPSSHVALIMSSSGTSGKPKGVEITHKGLLAMANNPFYRSSDEHLLPQKVVINLSYPHWITVQLTNITALSNGMKVVLIKEFSEQVFMNAVQQFRVNFSSLKPPEMTSLAKWPNTELYDTSSLRNLVCTGAVLRRAVREVAERRLKTRVYSVYGTTETLTTMMPPYNSPDMIESVGKLFTNVDAKVVDTETGLSLGPDCEGELCFRTPALMKGYRKDTVETREAIDDDGFFHTGDLGYVDHRGYFYYVDRIKERIRYIIYQFSASDIEEVLLGHPDVVEAAVVGVTHEKDTDHATAFLVRRPGSTVSAQDLASLVEGKLPWYKWLYGGVHFLESLPRTASGKLLKRTLRAYSTPIQR